MQYACSACCQRMPCILSQIHPSWLAEDVKFSSSSSAQRESVQRCSITAAVSVYRPAARCIALFYDQTLVVGNCYTATLTRFQPDRPDICLMSWGATKTQQTTNSVQCIKKGTCDVRYSSQHACVKYICEILPRRVEIIVHPCM